MPVKPDEAVLKSAASPIAPQFVIRPVKSTDLDGLLALAELAGPGFSSLQPDRTFLSKYIAKSVSAFAKPDANKPQKFLLVCETQEGQIIGCSAVKTGTGLAEPFINFDSHGIGPEQYLEASARFNGATEVGSLFLHPDYRRFGIGRYLAKVRYLLIANAPQVFHETVIAELRGVCDDHGSPFYNHIFRERLECSFDEADKIYAGLKPDQLEWVSPIGKIYMDELPLYVRAVIGQPNPAGRGALSLLESEGFLFSGSVDLFDGGPIVSAHRDTIRTAQASKLLKASISADDITASPALICRPSLKDFRAVIAPGQAIGRNIAVSAAALNALQTSPGAELRVWTPGMKRPIAKPMISEMDMGLSQSEDTPHV